MQAVKGYAARERVKASLLPWVVCFAATLFFFYEFIQGNMFASIADQIMKDFHIQADGVASLSGIYYISNVIFLFVAGMVLDRFAIKKIIIIAMVICVASTFILSWSHSFHIVMICRFMTGIGSAFCFLGPVRLATQWFPAQRMALVTGAIVTMAMTGGMLAQYPLTVLVNHVGWRHALQDVGYLGIAILVIMIVWIKEKPALTSAKKHSFSDIIAAAKNAYSNTQYLRAALFTSLMNMPIAIFGAMMGTLYLMQRLDLPKDQASLINSMLFLGAIIGGPLIGAFSDKLGQRILPMKAALIASIITALSILYLPVSYHLMMVLFFLLGFFTSAQVISYALVAESSPPAITATAVSVISILTQGGYTLYQHVYSQLLMFHGEAQMINNVPVYSLGDYQYASLILPCGLFIALLALSKLKETHYEQTVSQ